MRHNQLSKVHLSNVIKVNPRPPPHMGRFPMENVRPFVKGRKLTGVKKNELCDVAVFNETTDHWVKREIMMETTVLLIHWDVMGDVTEKLTLEKRK